MSNLGKLVVVGAVGVVCYYSFVEKRNPIADLWNNPIEEANKEYVEHKTKDISKIIDDNATVTKATLSGGVDRSIQKSASESTSETSN